MARSRYLPHVIARRALLGLFVLFVIGMGWLYIYRRSTTEEGVRPPAEPSDPARLEEHVLSGEGFGYGVTEEGEQKFRIDADRIVSDRLDNVVLEGVRLTLTTEGRRYHVQGNTGVYQKSSTDARVEGDVTVSGPDGLELQAAVLESRRDGKVLVSREGPVAFSLGAEYRGRADELYYHTGKEILRLSGAVRIETLDEEPAQAALSCDRLLYERETRLIHIEGNVELTSGESYLKAGRMALQMDDEEKRLRFVRAIWGVEGRRVHDAGLDMGSVSDFVGDTLSVEMKDGEPLYAEIDGAGDEDAVLETRDGAGLWRRMEAPSFTVDYADGVPQVARAYDGVEIVERLDFGNRPLVRKVCAEWLLAGFDRAGETEVLVLERFADYQEPGMQAFGDRIESAEGRITISGRPANVLTDRGLVLSDRITYEPEAGRLEAPGSVTAELPPEGRFTLMGSESKEPVRLTAQRAVWSDEPSTVEFQGNVRAWQDENYLLAQRLIGEMEGDQLRAEGQVKTVIKPKSEPEEPADGEEAKPPPEPIEVSAEQLLFRRPERLATYSGNARAHQVGRTLSCQELDIQLGEQDRFDSLTCREDTMVLDPAEGHTVQGREAHYRPDTGLVEITGSPVVMKDRDGTSISGSILIYDFETGTAQVKSGDPVAAEESAESTD